MPSMSLRPAVLFLAATLPAAAAGGDDFVRKVQTAAIAEGRAPLGHWGPDPANYTAWKTHTNRLIPVYTFGTRGAGRGIDLDDYAGANSAYRNAGSLERIYG